jgi:hypothetical protein
MKKSIFSRILSTVCVFAAVLSLLPALNLSADAAAYRNPSWYRKTGDVANEEKLLIENASGNGNGYFLYFKSSGFTSAQHGTSAVDGAWTFKSGKGTYTENAYFEFQKQSDGTYRIKCALKPGALNTYLGVSNGSLINAMDWHGDLKWKVERVGSNYRIRSASNTNLALKIDSSGARLVNVNSYSQSTQLSFYNIAICEDAAAVQPKVGQTYIFQTTNGLVLDIDDGKNNAIVWNRHGGWNQKWILQDAGDGYYYIKIESQNRWLDVYAATKKNGTNVTPYGTLHGGNNQKWKFISVGNDSYCIKSALGDWYLDVAGDDAGVKCGNNVQLWNSNTKDVWKLIPV